MKSDNFQLTNRRRWLQLAAGGLTVAALPLIGRTASPRQAPTGTVALANTGLTAKIVVIGGGMAGVTAAKYLRMWGGSGIQVTVVEPNARYTSNIMSNLVLNGSRTVSSLEYGYGALTSMYGVQVKQASVQSVDIANRKVSLSDGTVLPYDRLVAAPGIEFADAYGLTQNDYETRTPHAWRAGPQTTLLAQQVAAMTDGGVFVMTIPKAPYRCPPGPYERACLVADTLKTSGRGNSRVVILDENPKIQAEVENFTYAFNTVHAGVIQYVPSVTGIQIDPNAKTVTYTDGAGALQTLNAQVINPIVPHRAAGSAAGGWLAAAGLNNSADGKWCMVDVLSYESTAVPSVHVLGDASNCGMPKAGHVANQEAKICADAIVRMLGGSAPYAAPVANSACFSPITASTASWLTAVYQYDSVNKKMAVANNGGNIVGATPIEADTISSDNFSKMNTWFTTLMSDSFA